MSVKTKTVSSDGRIQYSMQTSCCNMPVEWFRTERPETCPYCGDPYWNKPGLEFKLFKLQDEFIADFEKTGSTRILGEKMFPIMVEYAENLIKMLLKGKACISPNDLRIKANDAATRLIEVILRASDYRMKVSFGGYLKRLCTNEAYSDKENDQTYSMQYIIGDDTEFGETISRTETRMGDDGDKVVETVTMSNKYEQQHDIESDLCGELCGLIKKTESIIKEDTQSEVTAILYLIGLHNKFVFRSDKIMNGFYEIAGNEVRDFVEKGELVIYRHLQKLTEG